MRILLSFMVWCAVFSATSAFTASQNDTQPNKYEVLPACRFEMSSSAYLCPVQLDRKIEADKVQDGQKVSLKTRFFFNPLPGISLVEGQLHPVTGQQGIDRGLSLEFTFDHLEEGNAQQLPVQARVLAVAAPERVNGAMAFPLIIADRYPPSLESKERLPGEIKKESMPEHRSKLDATPDLPAYRWNVCEKGCVELKDARGVFGYKHLSLETSPAPTQQALRSRLMVSRGRLSLKKGTILLLEIYGLPAPPTKTAAAPPDV